MGEQVVDRRFERFQAEAASPSPSDGQQRGADGPAQAQAPVAAGQEGDAGSIRSAASSDGERSVAVAVVPPPSQSRTGAAADSADASGRRAAEIARLTQAFSESSEPAPAPGAVQAAPSVGTGADAATNGSAAMRAAVDARASSAPAAPDGEAVESAFRASMSRGLDAALRQGGGSVTMRLTPPSLGAMRVELTLDQGVVEARLEATQQQAHELLTRNIQALKASLEARGLSVERIEITPPPPTTQDGLGQNDSGEEGDAGRTAQDGPQEETGGQRSDERSRDDGEPPPERMSDDQLESDLAMGAVERAGLALGLLNAVA